MNGHDSFEPSWFFPKSPISSPLSCGPDSSSGSDDSLENDYCTNFACCGLPLPDLHALLDHFEEQHIVVFNTEGQPVYPGLSPPSASSSRSRSPSPPSLGSSVVLSYPQPDPPSYKDALDALLEPLDASYSLVQAESTYRDVLARHHSPEYSSSSASSPVRNEPMCLPPALLSAPGDADATSGYTTPEYDAPEARRSLQHRDALHAGRPRARLLTAMERKARRAERLSPSKRRDREKMYKCPHPGCLKSYLNPNGLKYHLEKGTCLIDPNCIPPPPYDARDAYLPQ
ncbi:hypothetical protein SCP_1202990 [Sparassis crispa]|uniref:C2H2-type domain-containing protein n=1 Tax=Sparassis crispa TaxID=139825 RepID=A0A401H109_9APHY|nr:hypothetical protein SCP_1202990 [Sparassis crispa]GBE88070.1 hypothetical protein SCP_1202990 [Sparassis crispa]